MARPLVFILLVAALLSFAACSGSSSSRQTPGRVDVRIGGLRIDAELALTGEARSLGLGRRSSLAEGAGMLFVFREDGEEAFWMKEMGFPLDFVWISSDRKVVDLTQDVAPPAAGTPDSELPLYRPSHPVRYVLEVNAGVVRANGIGIGDVVTFEPDVSPEDAS